MSAWPLAPVTALALVAALGAGCEPAVHEVRRHTYAPSFGYLERRDLRDRMWALAAISTELDATLRSPEGAPDPARRARVVGLLRAMEAAVAALGAPGERTNHPMIDANLEAFARDVSAARAAAERDPPDLFLAGSVAGACRLCHR